VEANFASGYSLSAGGAIDKEKHRFRIELSLSDVFNFYEILLFKER